MIEQIYAASLDATLWPSVLERGLALIGGHAALVSRRERHTVRTSVCDSFNHSPPFLSAYTEYYGGLDPCFELGSSGYAGDKLGNGCDGELDALLAGYDMVYLWGVVSCSERQTPVISLQGRRSQQSPSEQGCERLAELVPHLRRAYAIHGEFCRLRVK